MSAHSLTSSLQLHTGFGWVRVASPMGPLDVFNTHTHANYSHKVVSSASDFKWDKLTRAGDDECLHAQEVPHTSGNSTMINYHIPADSFAPYRISQMWELAQVMLMITY
jgi:hypothetical protein